MSNDSGGGTHSYIFLSARLEPAAVRQDYRRVIGLWRCRRRETKQSLVEIALDVGCTNFAGS